MSSASLRRCLIQSCRIVVFESGITKPPSRVSSSVSTSRPGSESASAVRPKIGSTGLPSPTVASSASCPERSMNARISGMRDGLDHRQPQDGRGDESGRVADQLHPLRRPDVVDDDRRLRTSRSSPAISDSRPRVGSSRAPTANHERAGGEWRSTTPGSNIVDVISMTQPRVRCAPTTSAMRVDGHPVLHADQQAVVGQVRLDELSRPARVVRLASAGARQSNFARSVATSQRCIVRTSVRCDSSGMSMQQSVRAHGLDVGRPLLDQDDRGAASTRIEARWSPSEHDDHPGLRSSSSARWTMRRRREATADLLSARHGRLAELGERGVG